MEIRKIDIELDKRVETGPLQFGDDWPGVFIRGDNAAFYAFALSQYLEEGDKAWLAASQVRDLIRLLQGCRV